MHECAVVPGYIGIHCRHAVPKHSDSHYGGWYQQLSVNTEPCKVQANLLPEVLSVGLEVKEFMVMPEQTVKY